VVVPLDELGEGGIEAQIVGIGQVVLGDLRLGRCGDVAVGPPVVLCLRGLDRIVGVNGVTGRHGAGRKTDYEGGSTDRLA